MFVLGTTLGPFLAAYFGGAGKDAWEKTKELLSRLKENHKEQYPDHDMDEGLLIFKDTERRIFVGLYTHDPDEAYKKLFELDIPDEEQMSWGWNDEKGVWEATDLSEIPDMGLAPPRSHLGQRKQPLGSRQTPLSPVETASSRRKAPRSPEAFASDGWLITRPPRRSAGATRASA